MTHPVIALWAHPRSVSTATERVMRERGDFTVFHEPFLVDYYVHRAVREMPMMDAHGGQPQDYDSIVRRITTAAETGPVFFKDMSYYVMPRIQDDKSFARRTIDVFLIRDPRRSIASFYKLDPEFTSTEVGIEAQWRHLSFLKDELGKKPIVIEAEAVQADVRGVMTCLWEQIGIPVIDKAFEWQAGEVPKGWEYVRGWHNDVVSSSGIQRSAGTATEVFEDAAKTAGHLRGYLDHHLPFYEKLKKLSMPYPQA